MTSKQNKALINQYFDQIVWSMASFENCFSFFNDGRRFKLAPDVEMLPITIDNIHFMINYKKAWRYLLGLDINSLDPEKLYNSVSIMEKGCIDDKHIRKIKRDVCKPKTFEREFKKVLDITDPNERSAMIFYILNNCFTYGCMTKYLMSLSVMVANVVLIKHNEGILFVDERVAKRLDYYLQAFLECLPNIQAFMSEIKCNTFGVEMIG
ncbi:MAG: hypothetical protein IJ737_02550 [Ruminococcus sp.]|nr:hypothetical protein [Ruminococcus sp.]